MEKTTITLFLVILCVGVEYMLGASVDNGGTLQEAASGKSVKGVEGAMVKDVRNTLVAADSVVADPVPVNRAPANPAPANPAPVNPAPVKPASVNPAPVNPAPVNPVPVKPALPPHSNDHLNNKNTLTESKEKNGTVMKSNIQHQPSAQEVNRDTSPGTILYKTVLSNCSDVANLKDFLKEPIFSVCSNWTTSDQNLTLVSHTNKTRALCTLYFNGFATFCAKLKNLNKSLSDSAIQLTPRNDQVNYLEAIPICERLSKHINFVNDIPGCIDSCFDNGNFLLQCHLADHYFNYNLTAFKSVQQHGHEQTATNNSLNVIPHESDTIHSSNVEPNSNLTKLLMPDQSVNSPEKNGKPQEANQANNQIVQSVAEADSNPDQNVLDAKDKVNKNEETLPEPAKNGENDVPPEIEEPPAPQKLPAGQNPSVPQKTIVPQEGEGNDDQNVFDKDRMDQPEEEYTDESPKKPDEEKSIAKPNQLEEDTPISEDDIDGESYFFSYFMVVCVLFVLGYVFYHNRTKVMALVIEGKRNKRQYRGRRPNSANYHKLDSNLEEAISSSCTKSKSNIIY